MGCGVHNTIQKLGILGKTNDEWGIAIHVQNEYDRLLGENNYGKGIEIKQSNQLSILRVCKAPILRVILCHVRCDMSLGNTNRLLSLSKVNSFTVNADNYWH